MSHLQEQSRDRLPRIRKWLGALIGHFRRYSAAAAGYRALTADKRREADAEEWSEAMLPARGNELW